MIPFGAGRKHKTNKGRSTALDLDGFVGVKREPDMCFQRVANDHNGDRKDCLIHVRLLRELSDRDKLGQHAELLSRLGPILSITGTVIQCVGIASTEWIGALNQLKNLTRIAARAIFMQKCDVVVAS